MSFIKNKYYFIYFKIINKAVKKNRIKRNRNDLSYVYYEKHHMLPKKLFPRYDNESWNIVLLTAKEHFVCHHLLVKMTSGYNKRSMIFAYNNMLQINNNQNRYNPNATQYAKIKQLAANATADVQIERWKKNDYSESITQMSKLKNSPKWKETKGLEAIEKFKETTHNRDWIDTIGKDKKRKEKETKSNPKWIRTVGFNANTQLRKTINDPKWIETTGKDKSKNQSDTIRSIKWQIDNTIICEHCKLSMVGKGNYVRWHGNNCKENPYVVC